MTLRRLLGFTFVWAAVWWTSVQTTSAQNSHPNTITRPRQELAFDFSAMHSNAPVGGCGCFWLYGGGLTYALPVKHSPLAVVGDVDIAQGKSIGPNKDQLRLSYFTAGVRYMPDWHAGRLHLYTHATAGAAHASEALAAGATNSGLAFAFQVGGGLDADLSKRFRWRIVQADYALSTFNNANNNRQNNVELRSGMVLRF